MIKTTPSTKTQHPSTESIYTTAPVEPLHGATAAQPIWIRLPRNNEKCKYTGLSRTALNGIILGKNPPVRSVSLKKRYAVRGTRLIHLQSLLDYIDNAAAQQTAASPPSSGENHTAFDEAQGGIK